MGSNLKTKRELAPMFGLSMKQIGNLAIKNSWPFVDEAYRGGRIRKYDFDSPQVQKSLKERNGNGKSDGSGAPKSPLIPPSSTALAVVDQPLPFKPFSSLQEEDFKTLPEEKKIWTPERALNPDDLKDPKFIEKVAILREIDEMPASWKEGRRAWVEKVARKHGKHPATIYRWLKERSGYDIAGLRHKNSGKEKASAWRPLESLEFWQGLFLKREHRGINIKNLYSIMQQEAQRRGWEIGKYRSAVWWVNRIKKPLKGFSRGGARALDNALPPILVDHSDMAPFEIVVGDQHRFDRWIVDEESGEIFRPECYMWQDLRSRIIYGAAIDKRYDSWLMGLGLWVGIHVFGTFGSLYLDHGKPELSLYIQDILNGMKAFGMTWENTTDCSIDLNVVDGEASVPLMRKPGERILTVVKNAKAKMEERTFRTIEEIMESFFRLAGRTKRLKDDIHWQEVDQREAETLAKRGKLLTASEHAIFFYKALDYYNRERPHRGVLNEWIWKPKPKSATPFDCLVSCYREGWRPRKISDAAADLIFLVRAERTVRLGRLEFMGDFYENEALVGIEGRVCLRYNPMDLSEIQVFQNGKYLCGAVPVERSSMKNLTLAERKIHEKRARAKRFSEEFKRLTRNIPDFRQYSTVPAAERVAAQIGKDRKRKAEEAAAFSRRRSELELEIEVAKIEARALLPAKTKPAPERPPFFKYKSERHEYLIKSQINGWEISAEDQRWLDEFERKARPEQREQWNVRRETSYS